MKPIYLSAPLIIAAAALVFWSSLPKKAEAKSPTSPGITVAELFTSQSCSSCPPAEALFSKLANQENLLTIEWHVDYWDTLVHGGSKWKDVYSHREYTERQRAYNRSLRGTSGVYTPQAVVNGRQEAVGNRPTEVRNLLRSAKPLTVPVQIENNMAQIGADKDAVDVTFVRLLKTHETNVFGGENKGRKLFGKHIVLETKVLGKTRNNPVSFHLPPVADGETCAVLIQALKSDIGPIIGAAKCPS